MGILVECRKNFGDFELAVQFEAENEIVGLLGASGCGKSMTLKCIAGIVRPDEGRIVLDGVTLFDSAARIDLPPQQRHVGLLFQNYALFPNMTVAENLTGVLRLRRPDDLRARMKSLVGKFYIEGLENHYPAQLSGGQQQRVALARIMASDPKILMLDEPLSALDSYLRWQIEDRLAEILADFAGTTLYVSHNRDEIYRLCKRVCIVNGGTSEPMRTIAELFERPSTLSSALLSGCKNYSRAACPEPGLVTALDWGVTLACAGARQDEADFIGVRAHYVRPCAAAAENAFVCRVLRVTEDVFSSVVNLLPTEAAEPEKDFSRIRMELPKADARAIRAGDLLTVSVAPRDIMLLRR